MPCPFPGMDPYIESQAWEDFHLHLVAEIANALVPQVRPRYIVRTERRIYVEHEPDSTSGTIRADVAEMSAGGALSPSAQATSATELATGPVVLTLPMPAERREAFLTIRDRDTHEVVTVIELLSPSNRRRGGEGRGEYLRKRETVLQSAANLSSSICCVRASGCRRSNLCHASTTTRSSRDRNLARGSRFMRGS